MKIELTDDEIARLVEMREDDEPHGRWPWVTDSDVEE